MKIKQLSVSALCLLVYLAFYNLLFNLKVNNVWLWSGILQLILITGLSFLFVSWLKISYKKYFALALLPQLFLSFIGTMLCNVYMIIPMPDIGEFIDNLLSTEFLAYMQIITTWQLVLVAIGLIIKRENFSSITKHAQEQFAFISILSGGMAVAAMVATVPQIFNGSSSNMFWICIIGAPLAHFLIFFALEKPFTKMLGATVGQYYFYCYGAFYIITCLVFASFGALILLFSNSGGANGGSLVLIFSYMLNGCITVAAIPATIRYFISKIPYLWLKIILNILLAVVVLGLGVAGYYLRLHKNL